jgi:predicted kinase
MDEATELPPPPEPPDWRIDWVGLAATCSWIAPLKEALAACPQDPVFHAEGNAWQHTQAVCAALAAMPAWRALPPEERRVLFAAALLHDSGKPACTQQELDGRISTRGHARRGAILARRLLWEARTPFAVREEIAALVRYHQLPFFLLERDDPRRLAFAASQSVRCDHLALLAEADALGRQCAPADRQRMLDNTSLFAELCREHDCFDHPRRFPSDHSRFLYFQRDGRDPNYAAYDDLRCNATVMSGLPGAGKDHWIREHVADLPIISLDDIRRTLGASPTGDQRAVIEQARAAARAHLRAGRSFVWNATNVSRQVRRECIAFLAAYDARIHVVYVEAPRAALFRQNQARPRPVPEAAIRRLLDRWEVPDLTESHQVEFVVH